MYIIESDSLNSWSSDGCDCDGVMLMKLGEEKVMVYSDEVMRMCKLTVMVYADEVMVIRRGSDNLYFPITPNFKVAYYENNDNNYIIIS